MEIFKQIAPLKAFLKDLKCQGKSIGLVPTMGALHPGHVSLIRASQKENQVTVSTIFVNPTQFNNPNDLLHYPRSIDADTKLLESTGCDVLFNPDDHEMYPEKSVLGLSFGHLDKVMEGKFRPGHFSGVALVVSKLFNIVQPDNAYFGQKDWQQFAIIQRLVENLSFNIYLHSVATMRETDGLALSSRNRRLNPQQREKAVVFHNSLQHARWALQQGNDFNNVKIEVKSTIEKLPDVKLEYFELADSKTLYLLDHVEAAEQPILCIAGYVGEIRLIDNVFIKEQPST